VHDNRRNGGDDQDEMPDNGEDVGVLDGKVTAPVLIGQVRAEEGSEVRPELIEGCEAGGSTLSKTKGP
jgi:hypothetical protein